jgi:predicted RNA-binding Zn-ribbon protein involved in translation (DUF1610 family)
MARVLFILGGVLTLAGGVLWLFSLGPARAATVLSTMAAICLQSGVACVVVGLLVHARQRFFASFGGRDARATGGTGHPGSGAVPATGAGEEPAPALCHACGYDCSDLVRGIYACPECGVVLSRIPRGVRSGPDAAPTEARENADRDAG